MVEIAGYLHDIRKLAISSDVLEKSTKLNDEEMNEVKKHAYFTYMILCNIKGFEEIAMWAACHHERLDGNGYPFHISGDNYSKFARIIAVADILTAITEDRPYRTGMESEEALGILSNMVKNGGIDSGITEIVRANFDEINTVRINAQLEELKDYEDFYDIESGSDW